MANNDRTSKGTNAAVKSFVVLQNTADDVRRRFKEDRGATMVEYGLLLSGALVIASGVVVIFGQRVLGLFEAVDTEFESVRPNNGNEAG